MMPGIPPELVPYEQKHCHLQQSPNARPSEIEAALRISCYETINAYLISWDDEAEFGEQVDAFD